MAGPTEFDMEAGARGRATRKAAKDAAKAAATQEAEATAGQLTKEQLQGMTAEQVAAAYDSGHLNSAMGWEPADVKVIDRARRGDKLTSEDVKVLARLEQHQLIIQAFEAGNIEDGDASAAAAVTETED